MLALTLYRLGSYFARVLPLKIRTLITATVAQVSCLVRVGTRRNIERNLALVHGRSLDRRGLRRMSRRVVLNFARTIQVFLELPTYRWEEVRARLEMSEFESAVRGLGEHPVFVLASIHMGPWELGGLCLSSLGFRIHTAALDHPSAGVTRFFEERRSQSGMINHPMRGSFNILKEALQRGDSVALLVDRAYGGTPKRFDFFGVQPEFPLGHLFLAAACQVPIMTGALVFDTGDRVRYIHGGVYYPPASAEDVDALEAIERKCLADFERFIREHSDQWFQFELLERSGQK